MNCIALLRGINVGGHRVTMERLRELFVALDFDSVETFIASGNVFFQTQETDTRLLERQIEAHLKHELGYDVATFLRTPAELSALCANCPFTLAGDDTLYVTFLKGPVDAMTKQGLTDLETKTDAFAFVGREYFRRIHGKLTASDLPEVQLNRLLKGQVGTARNYTTVQKLTAKYASAPISSCGVSPGFGREIGDLEGWRRSVFEE